MRISDWSSDVCSSDLQPHDHIVKSHDDERNRVIGEILRMGEMAAAQLEAALDVVERREDKAADRIIANDEATDALERKVGHHALRSEERRVGKEGVRTGRTRWHQHN